MKRKLLEGDIVLGTCLVNMYAKCSQLEEARKVFDSLPTRNAVTWTAMMNGYGRNNEGHKATACFEEMMLAGIQPDDTTFTCLLVACSNAGLVSKGRQYFDAMGKQYGFNPTTEHHVCMVDLLGRAGHLGEAEKVLKSAGCENDAVGLMSLLNACKSRGDIERGTRCFEIYLFGMHTYPPGRATMANNHMYQLPAVFFGCGMKVLALLYSSYTGTWFQGGTQKSHNRLDSPAAYLQNDSGPLSSLYMPFPSITI